MEYANDPNGSVYVLNSDATAHFYMEILIASREDELPEVAFYVYIHKMGERRKKQALSKKPLSGDIMEYQDKIKVHHFTPLWVPPS